MTDNDKTRKQLIAENEELRQRVSALEGSKSQRRRAEEALQTARDELERRVEGRTAELAKANESLDIFRKFVEASGEGFGMSDFDGRIAYANPTLCRLFGEEEPEDVVGKNVSAYYPAEYEQRRKKEMLPALLQKGYWHAEITVLPRHGKPVSTLQSTFVIRDEEGNPFRIAVVITDITARKQAEAALQESEEKYRTLVETSPDAVIMADLEGHVTFASPRALQMYGTENAGELLGKNPLDFFAPEDHQEFLTKLRETVEEGVTQDVEYNFVRKDRTRFVGEASSAMIRDASGRPTGFVSIVRDITERKRTEEALRRSEERYDLAVRGAGVGIWDWDIRTGKVYFSPRWKMLFGYDEKDIGDSLEDWAGLLHPDERDWILKFQADFLAGTSPTVTVEYRLRHKDGSYRWIVAHGLVVRDEQGRACRLVGSHGDITDRKRAEEAVERERRTLKHMLEASDHERQLIAYDIHDGLAQELAGAMMQFQIYAHARKTNSKDAAKVFDTGTAMLQKSHAEARRLISGVRPPILDESGVMAAIAHLVYEPAFDPGPKIDFRNRVTFKRLVPVLENVVYRIVQEGLTNARNHSRSDRILVSLKQRDDRLRIEIRDWGIGFDPKTVHENRFGLQGIRQRARLLGGRCSVKSKPGEGTSIVVELPVVERESEQ